MNLSHFLPSPDIHHTVQPSKHRRYWYTIINGYSPVPLGHFAFLAPGLFCVYLRPLRIKSMTSCASPTVYLCRPRIGNWAYHIRTHQVPNMLWTIKATLEHNPIVPIRNSNATALQQHLYDPYRAMGLTFNRWWSFRPSLVAQRPIEIGNVLPTSASVPLCECFIIGKRNHMQSVFWCDALIIQFLPACLPACLSVAAEQSKASWGDDIFMCSEQSQ